MGSVAGGRLAAAVSDAGALGLVGGGYGNPGWMRDELSIVRSETTRPWGVGLITWHASQEIVELALSYEPYAFMMSFGDPRPFVPAIKEAGYTLICQVQDVEDARVAKAAGADIIVAQGTEAGGHGANRSTLPLVPAVVDAVVPTPVLAAGGIVDGRGLAAALMLGAQGALMGPLLRSHRSSGPPKGLGAYRGRQGWRHSENAGFRRGAPACVASALHRTRHT